MNKSHVRVLMILAFGLAILTGCASTRTAGCMCPDRREVLAAVYTLFNAMESRDVEAAERVLLPEGVVYSAGRVNGELRLSHFTNAGFMQDLPDRTDDVRETITDPTVLIDGDVAMVWADYRFERNGELSHTGVNAFALVRTVDGWKIAGGAFSFIPAATLQDAADE